VLDTGYLIRGHPDVVPTKVGNHLKDWFPVFTGNPGFRLEFILMKIGAGMTNLIEEAIYKQAPNKLYHWIGGLVNGKKYVFRLGKDSILK
jgi:hypothetical protein